MNSMIDNSRLHTLNRQTFDIDIPSSWVDELCYNREPDLFTPQQPYTPTQPIYLSYFPKKRKKLESENIRFDAAEEDLSAGMVIEKTRSRDGGSYYILRGSRYTAFANPGKGKNTNVPIAKLSSLKPTQNNTPRNNESVIHIEFREIFDEAACDLEKIYSEILETLNNENKRQVAKKRLSAAAQNELLQVRPEKNLIGHKALHSEVRKRYGALRALMELAKHRAEVDYFGEADGEILDQQDIGETNTINGTEYKIHDSELVAIKTRNIKGRFDEDCLVGIATENNKNTLKSRIETIENGYFYIRVENKEIFKPGEDLKLSRIQKFSMQNHKRCLQDFLDEKTAGSWENLASLLCTPENLGVENHTPPESFFCDHIPESHPLNDEQRKAVIGALSTPHAFFIQGPPGTGKTTVITEIVQQLAAKGERVLLLAPTHVAVDEVLRRVGNSNGLFPVRLAWDDSRVNRDVRCYTLSEVKTEIIKNMRRPETSHADKWQKKIDRHELELEELDKTMVLKNAYQDSLKNEKEKQKQLETWRTEYLSEKEQTKRALKNQVILLGAKESALAKTYNALGRLKRELVGMAEKKGAVRRFFSNIAGEMAEHKAKISTAEKNQIQFSKEHQTILTCKRDLENRLARLAADGPQKESALELAIQEAIEIKHNVESEWKQKALEIEKCKGIMVDTFLTRRDELVDRLDSLKKYTELEQKWFEVTGMSAESEKPQIEAIAGEIGDDLLQSVNLVCATTTGIAGSPFARKTVFDTLIVDEASRVTDSEFLIGAVRSHRWILVGDEHQLPPFVDQRDEHHLHALAALHKTEQDPGTGCEQAVDELARIWNEDEELHLFRKDSVLKMAEKIHQSGDWDNHYRETFQSAYKHFAYSSHNPEHEFLKTMITYLVRSLFERCVTRVPDSMRQRLIEQRRMIDPLAEIVREPIYKDQYKSPSEEELQACGVIPFTTSGFNRPVTFLDTSRYGARAAEELIRNGFVNDLECEWITDACVHFEDELRKRDESATVSVLCFYRAQSRKIQKRLGAPLFRNFRKIRFEVIDAIDKIQGQESDIVFISFCRARTKGRPGARFGQWLQDLRRLNVACTRAHRAIVFVGHKTTLENLSFSENAQHFYSNLFALLKNDPAMQIKSDFKIGK